MALPELERGLADLTSTHRIGPEARYCRTAIFCLSNSLKGVRAEYLKLFLRDPRLDPVFPWAERSEQIKPLLANAFSAEMIRGLSRAGFTAVDSVNQFIFLGDATAPDFDVSFMNAYRAFQEAMTPIQSESTPPHTIGFFLLKNVPGSSESASVSSAAVLASLKSAHEVLDKIVVLDTVNPRSVLISTSADWLCLICHGLYWLTDLPLKHLRQASLQDYSQWLKRKIDTTARVSGFSGLSMVLPMEWILESLAVLKGSEVLQSVLLTTERKGSENGPEGYLNALNLNSIDSLRSHLVQNPKVSFPNPLADIPEWSLPSAREFMRKVDLLDAALPGYAKDYRDTFIKVSKKLEREAGFKFDEYLAGIISRSHGGLARAGTIIQKIRGHLDLLIGQIPPAATYDDPAVISLKIHNQLKDGPSGLAVAIRTVLMALTVFLGCGTLTNGVLKDLALRSLASGTIVIAGYIYWHSWRTRLNRRVIELMNRVHRKWVVLLDNAIRSTQEETVNHIIPKVEEAQKEIERAISRAEELDRFYTTQYLPAKPVESSFWRPILVDRKDLLREYLPRVPLDIIDTAGQFLREETILESWKRFGLPEDQIPNEWESILLERASLKTLPGLREVAAVSVCEGARSHPEILSEFTQALKTTAGPFLKTVPGSDAISVRPTIECPEGCEDILRVILDDLQTCVGRPMIAYSGCRYRLSYLAYADDIRLDSVRIE